MPLNVASGMPKCSKIRFGLGLRCRPLAGAHIHLSDPLRHIEIGENRKVFPGPATFGGFAIADEIKQIVCLFH